MSLWVEKLQSVRQDGSNEVSWLDSDGLTEREVEVLRLLAEGMTDKEIANLLFISHKTVGNHVTHIREKTHARNRVEISRYASEHSLLKS